MKNFARLPTVLAFALLALALSSSAAAAQSKEAFTQERFEALQAENALILIDVFADWCPTCALQQDVLDEFRNEHPDVPVHTLSVNFDDQKEWVRHFKAPRQSTLILYRGEEQLWFSVAETRADRIVNEILTAASRDR
ncbi:MAG: thioredoxin family protein [Gemmatimonadota bacterium]